MTRHANLTTLRDQIGQSRLAKRGIMMNQHEDRLGLSSAEDTVTPESELLQVRDALRGLRFGTVTIIVQDGVVVQIDRTEKRRIRRGNGKTE